MYFVNEIRKIPLFRIIIPFILGIVSNLYLNISIPYSLTVIVSFLILLVIVSIYQVKFRETLFVLAFFTILFSAGNELVNHQNKSTNKLNNFYSYIAEVTKEPKIKEKSVQLEVELKYYKNEGTLNTIDEKILIYLPIDTNSINLSIGQLIVFQSNFQEIKNLGNPNEFDYQTYMANHQIYNQTYINSYNWKIVNTQPNLTIQAKALKIRGRIIQLFKEYGISDQQLAVLSALALGYKNNLDAEIKHAYAASGGMHVLAVSGLHVGIIFVIISFLLKPLNKRRFGNYLSVGIIILFLWFYALLTGLSPSVFRASTMFTIIAIGTLFKKNTNIYNSLAASAFILLIINPFIISEIGFQLSYLAVIGIVYFHPRIYNLFHIHNFFLDKIWSLTAVSVAAQIATAPISLYYFGQFPVYFLLTNFLVIPFASILIYGTIIFLLFSFISPFALLIAKLLEFLVLALNNSILFIENIPGSLITNIQLNGISMILLYIIIILFAAYFAYENKKYFFMGFVSIIMFFSIISLEKTIDLFSNHLIVFNIPKNTFIQLKEKETTINISNSFNKNENKLITYYLKDDSKHKNIVISSSDSLHKKQELFLVYCNKKVFIPTNNTLSTYIFPESKLEIDYLIITNKMPLTLTELLEYISPEKIIFDASVPSYNLMNWKEICSKNDIPFHITKYDGAFII